MQGSEEFEEMVKHTYSAEQRPRQMAEVGLVLSTP
jgi:hypothetical protein